MRHFRSHLNRSCASAVLAVSALLAGCSDGGGSSPSAPATAPSAPDPAAASQQGADTGGSATAGAKVAVSGVAFKGAIANASVNVCAHADTGKLLNCSLVGVDSAGRYTASMPVAPYYRATLVAGAGTVTQDEATGATLSLPSAFKLEALAYVPSGNTATLNLTPFSSAHFNAVQGIGVSPANMASTSAAMTALLGFDPLSTPTVDLRTAGILNQPAAVKAQSVALAALSQMAKDGASGCVAGGGAAINCVNDIVKSGLRIDATTLSATMDGRLHVQASTAAQRVQRSAPGSQFAGSPILVLQRSVSERVNATVQAASDGIIDIANSWYAYLYDVGAYTQGSRASAALDSLYSGLLSLETALADIPADVAADFVTIAKEARAAYFRYFDEMHACFELRTQCDDTRYRDIVWNDFAVDYLGKSVARSIALGVTGGITTAGAATDATFELFKAVGLGVATYESKIGLISADEAAAMSGAFATVADVAKLLAALHEARIDAQKYLANAEKGFASIRTGMKGAKFDKWHLARFRSGIRRMLVASRDMVIKSVDVAMELDDANKSNVLGRLLSEIDDLIAAADSGSFGATIPPPVLTGVAPASGAAVGEATDFTLSGYDLPATLRIEGTNCSGLPITVTGTTFRCTPTAVGQLRFQVLDGSSGATIATLTSSASSPQPLIGTRYAKFCVNGEQAGTGVCTTIAAAGSSPTEWGCTKDQRTGLYWEVKTADGGIRDRNRLLRGFNQASPTDAEQLRDVNASRLCGFSDWRIPTREELLDLVDFAIASPGPTLTAAAFPNVDGVAYRTSSGTAFQTGTFWAIDFSVGKTIAILASTPTRIMLVRGATVAASDRFVVSADGNEMHDRIDNVFWQRAVAGSGTYTWSGAQALAASESQRTGKKLRLPTAREFARFVTLEATNPVRTYAGPILRSTSYWTGTPKAGDPSQAWFMFATEGSLATTTVGSATGNGMLLVRDP